MSTAIVREEGRLLGPWVKARNIAASRVGSIHDDDAARKLGFRGALVSGRVHLNTFVPLLIEAFGSGWFESGTLSQDFRYATVDEEETRAVIGKPPAGGAEAQVDAFIELPDSRVVTIGSASLGLPSEPTWLGRKDVGAYDQGPYNLVAAVTPGDQFPRVEVTVTPQAAERINVGSVMLPWYKDGSPWGPPVVSPGAMVGALGAGCGAYLRDHRVQGVAIDGATEIRNINGPVFIERPYWASGEIVARGQSPRTEYFWYDAWLDDESGRRIAEMRLQWRCVKGSA